MKNTICIFFLGSLIDEKKRSNRGENVGFCGQVFNGSIYGYTFGVGIYRMEKDVENDCMNVVEVVADMPTIRKAAKEYFKNKRFLFVVNDAESVNFFEFLASQNLESILQSASLNTNNRCGLCFRDIKGFGDILTEKAEKIASVSIPDFCNLYNTEKAQSGESFNLGNFAEYVLTGKKSDLDKRRFDKKKQDAFICGKRYEVKASLNIPVKDSSKSNTNFFFTL